MNEELIETLRIIIDRYQGRTQGSVFIPISDFPWNGTRDGQLTKLQKKGLITEPRYSGNGADITLTEQGRHFFDDKKTETLTKNKILQILDSLSKDDQCDYKDLGYSDKRDYWAAIEQLWKWDLVSLQREPVYGGWDARPSMLWMQGATVTPQGYKYMEDNAVSNENGKQPKIFISHRGTESELAEVIVDFFENIGVHSENIVCTSVAGHLVPNGEKIYDWLQRQFVEYDLHVILLLTHAYYKSAYCLNEMGAAWATKSRFDVILTPGFSPNDMQGFIDSHTMAIDWNANDEILADRLGQLRDLICEEFDLRKTDDRRWKKIRTEVIDGVKKATPSESETEDD